ncbi:unnamed protein product [Acanthoscelides obtectus]|uniref:Uncharacterized protein n=1 Tax=Acanthoscelides obtectus TaxID=200917 RepID=A0A9P0Q890_ACAOB|nr:unnamed protein product [Acanthoscelides obtectus]CAK1622372.1 hypothetical protein AOBTE_LOCUS1448 [Acanthoscelides obtectus]
MYEWRRPLKLHELLEELEHPDRIPVLPDGLVLYPPENANDDVTDCDSGDEEFRSLSNPPGSQLRNDVEIIGDAMSIQNRPPSVISSIQEDYEQLYDSEDDIPLSQPYPKASASNLEGMYMPSFDKKAQDTIMD